jgi:hypothetical protein
VPEMQTVMVKVTEVTERDRKERDRKERDRKVEEWVKHIENLNYALKLGLGTTLYPETAKPLLQLFRLLEKSLPKLKNAKRGKQLESRST